MNEHRLLNLRILLLLSLMFIRINVFSILTVDSSHNSVSTIDLLLKPSSSLG
jgi:hypothetical protein